MKKTLLIELFVYILLVVIRIILMFLYESEEKEIVIPQDFKIERGEADAPIHFE